MKVNWFNESEINIEVAQSQIKYFINQSGDFHKQFTPFDLCIEIVDKLVQENSILETSEVLVIANLEFLYVLLKYFSFKGFSRKNITFATPCLLKAKYTENHGVNILVYNYDKLDLGMKKFDVVIGNPPYSVKKKGAKTPRLLIEDFTKLSIGLADKVILVLPTSWIFDAKKKITKNIISFGIKEAIECSEYFPSIQLRTGIFFLEKGFRDKVKIQNDKKEVFFTKIDNIIPLYDNEISVYIKQKIKEKNEWLSSLWGRSDMICRNDPRIGHGETQIIQITGPKDKKIDFFKADIPKESFAHFDKWKVITNGMGNLQGSEYIGVTKIAPPNCGGLYNIISFGVDTEHEAKNLVSYFNLKLIRLLIKGIRSSANNSKVVFDCIPKVNFTKSWTDQELYKYFGLSEEEIKLIEDEIK